MKLLDFKNYNLLEKNGPHKYGCLMLEFDFPEIDQIHDKINKNDLAKDGLETEPHITLLYGLHDAEIKDKDVLESVKGFNIPKLKLHNISLFENDEFDVLKFDVDSLEEGKTLHKINAKLKKFPYTTDFEDYHPHATIAYLKPGKGGLYVEKFKGSEFTVEPKQLVYSKSDGKKLFASIAGYCPSYGVGTTYSCGSRYNSPYLIGYTSQSFGGGY